MGSRWRGSRSGALWARWPVQLASALLGSSIVLALVGPVGALEQASPVDAASAGLFNGLGGDEQTPDGSRGERSAGGSAAEPEPRYERPRYRNSRAVGLPNDGRLVRGVRVPPEGRDFFTWDPVKHRRPNRSWRLWGTDDLVRLTLRVLREHRRANPDAPRLGIGDLSRRRGGDFGPQYGGIGHASHQNGLDVDIYYPRLDRRERHPKQVEQVDLELSQDLVDRFVAAGAEYVFVGPNTPLTGPPDVVQPLPHHDNHIHVRIFPGDARP